MERLELLTCRFSTRCFRPLDHGVLLTLGFVLYVRYRSVCKFKKNLCNELLYYVQNFCKKFEKTFWKLFSQTQIFETQLEIEGERERGREKDGERERKRERENLSSAFVKVC